VKSDRLLSILLLLQAHGRLSARVLAQRLEVAERTIHRDIEALSAAGIPVYTERGRNGGLALLPGFRTDVSGLTGPEARALFIFAGRGTLADLGLEGDLRGALRKLMASLPETQRPEAAEAAERVLVDPRGWMRKGDDVPHLAFIQAAVWESRQLRVAYRNSEGGEGRERVLDPYGLVAKAGVWYLVAGDAGGPRLYRVSRIQSVEATGLVAVRPPNLKLEELWETLRRRVEDRGSGVMVTLRVRPEALERLLRVTASQLTGPAEHDSGPAETLLRLPFVAEGAARGVLLGFGVDIEVLDPPSLRIEMRAVAGAVVALYSD